MKEKIKITLDENHYLNCEEITIARRDENDVKEFEIELPKNLTDYWVFMDFEKSDGQKIKTPKLNVTDGIAYYVIPNSLVDIGGTLKTQIVLQKESGEIWKSDTKTFFVENSINATEDIPEDEREDFITEAQKLLEEIKQNGGGTITDVLVDGKSVVTDGIANISLSNLEKTLQDILTIIQGGGLDELTISKIEELIVSYFESKTVEEVER
jgi:hypothetical protein